MHGPAEQRSDEKVLPADADAIYDSMRSTVALASSSSSIRRSVLGEDEEGWWLLALARTGHGEGRASCVGMRPEIASIFGIAPFEAARRGPLTRRRDLFSPRDMTTARVGC